MPTVNLVEGSQPKDNSLLVKYFAPAFRPEFLGKKAGDEFTIQLLTAFEEKERTWILQDLGLNKESACRCRKIFQNGNRESGPSGKSSTG